jgi:addiction module RelB/DinJ family antitoxin
MSTNKAKSAEVRARVDAALKTEAEAVLGALGLSAGEAIRLFYTQVALRRGLPFEVTIPANGAGAAGPKAKTKRGRKPKRAPEDYPVPHTPNAETRKVLREADEGKNLTSYESVNAMFEAILGPSWREKDPR